LYVPPSSAVGSAAELEGHCTVVISQKDVHSTPDAREWVFGRLNAANEKALASLPGEQKRPGGYNNSYYSR
jgi:hypothetical protein